MSKPQKPFDPQFDKKPQLPAHLFTNTSAPSLYSEKHLMAPRFRKRQADIAVNGPNANGEIWFAITGPEISGDLITNLTIVAEFPAIRHPSEPIAEYPLNFVPGKAGPNVGHVEKSMPPVPPTSDRSGYESGSGSLDRSVESTFAHIDGELTIDSNTDYQKSLSEQSQSIVMPESDYVYWVNSLGNALFQEIYIEADNEPGKRLTSHSGKWLEVRDNLHGHANCPNDESVGRFFDENELYANSRKYQHVYVDPDFWFQTHPSKALLTKGLRNTLVVKAKLNDFRQLYHTSEDHIGKDSKTVPYHLFRDDKVTLGDIKFSARINVVDLGDDRLQLLSSDRTTRFSHIKELTFDRGYNRGLKADQDSFIPLDIRRQGLVREMYCTVQHPSHVSKKEGLNFTGRSSGEPLVAMSITAGNIPITPEREAAWFREKGAASAGLMTPRQYIYTHQFGLSPATAEQEIGYLDTDEHPLRANVLLQRGLGPDAKIHVFLSRLGVFVIQDGVAKMVLH